MNGFKEVKVCYDIERGNYSCCNAVGDCETRMLSLPGNVNFFFFDNQIFQSYQLISLISSQSYLK